MNLYLVERTDEKAKNYNQYYAFVCVAGSHDEARAMVPNPSDKYYLECWASPENLRVTHLGEAAAQAKAGVVLAANVGA